MASLETKKAGQWIVVEGLDGVGKSTITAELARVMNAHLCRTPGAELAYLRPHFDNQPAPVRRAFYALGNLCAGHAAQDLVASGRTVIMDRYWPSTAAYSSLDVAIDSTPSVVWPSDLPRPSLIVLLTLDDAVRQERIRLRANDGVVLITDEERSLQIADKRTKVLTAYRNILRTIDPPPSTPSSSTNPVPVTRCFEIDCGKDTPSAIVHRILAHISR